MKSIGVFAFCLFAALGAVPTRADTATPEEIAKAQAAISRQLLDAGSAQFKITAIRHVGKAVVFCGFVNAKNQFGGYTGFRPFVLFADDLTINDGRPGTGPAFAQLQEMMCGSA